MCCAESNSHWCQDLTQGPDAIYSLQLPPPGLACDLLPHQIAGLAWLKKRESTDSPLKSDGAKAEDPAEDGEELTELKMPERDPKKEAAAAKKQKKQKKAGAQTEKFGGILADDMGLGKTVQMSA
jgi:SNF2 family DNA or RNA helicase